MSIDALPAAPSRTDQTTFAARADAFVAALPTWATQANALAVEVNGYAVAAAASRGAAESSASAAATSQLIAEGAANYRGDYSAGTQYTVGQSVSYSGSRYVAKTTTLGNLPTNGTYWLTLTNNGTVTQIVASTGLTGGTINTTGTIAIDKATDNQFRAATSNKVITADLLNSANAPITSTGSGTFNLDFGSGNSGCGRVFLRTITGASNSLGNPTNAVAGQSGLVMVKQDGTGGRPLSYGSAWKFPGGTPSSIGTASNAVNVFAYYVVSSSEIVLSYLGSY